MRGLLPVFLICAWMLGGQTTAPTFQTLSRQAEAARDAKQLEKAIALYQRALRLKPDWDEGLWNLGSLAYDLDKYDECAPAFRKLVVLKPDSAPGWTMSGLCEYRLRRYDAALDSLTRAETLKFEGPPELARAGRLHMALMLTKSGSFERAITVLTEMTLVHRKAPDIVAAAGIAGLRQPWLPFEVPEANRDLVFQLGDAMGSAMEKDYKEATEKFEATLRQYPQEANVHFRFGAFLNIQDSARGIEEIRKAVELAPDHVPALVGLTVMYLKREEFDSALEFGERAVKAGPEDFSTHIALGRALLAKENVARAATELEAAVKLAPASPEARFSLASAYSRLGRKADSARELGEFKRLQKLEK
ncbi:MAG: tetratricopeptide repeat protein [Candidatus Solibacter sp.]